jgi:hypothetical protein
MPPKAAVDLMVAAIDNCDVGQDIIEMHWEFIEINGSPRRFLASDRQFGIYLRKRAAGLYHPAYIADEAGWSADEKDPRPGDRSPATRPRLSPG